MIWWNDWVLTGGLFGMMCDHLWDWMAGRSHLEEIFLVSGNSRSKALRQMMRLASSRRETLASRIGVDERSCHSCPGEAPGTPLHRALGAWQAVCSLCLCSRTSQWRVLSRAMAYSGLYVIKYNLAALWQRGWASVAEAGRQTRRLWTCSHARWWWLGPGAVEVKRGNRWGRSLGGKIRATCPGEGRLDWREEKESSSQKPVAWAAVRVIVLLAERGSWGRSRLQTGINCWDVFIWRRPGLGFPVARW